MEQALEPTFGEYSILVKRIVNCRFDHIQSASQIAAIRKLEEVAFHRFLNAVKNLDVGTNADGSQITLRYVDDGEQSNAYLVDEAGDEQFDRSEWYGSDGVTPLELGNICAECLRPRSTNVQPA